jgi:hypothetical protein
LGLLVVCAAAAVSRQRARKNETRR